ncbi:hypothetical protein AALO_G00293860 [Alosa alosa]|uniref:Alkylated DNA repair protein AlkB homologue 8 N-terminal domain-containing protein n=1 Tax=Alosa alosa TaxID=278164 RepID=A0AAV6FKV5_9TELE|nr:hypothetical protein AALO_G00293860 [Alosa alosa]
MVVDFRRSKPARKYLGIHLDNKLDWSVNTEALYKKGQSRLYFLKRLRSFNVCSKLLWMFYQSVVVSVLFYAVLNACNYLALFSSSDTQVIAEIVSAPKTWR